MRQAMIYRESDEPCTIKEIYPGSKVNLPHIGETVEITNALTKKTYQAKVIKTNRFLHTYSVSTQ